MPQVRSVGKFIFVDTVGNILTAPLWWYSSGVYFAARYCLLFLRRRWEAVGVGVWAKNIFVPMYGQNDIAGSIISFFVRAIQIVVRAFIMLIWVIIGVAMFLAYLAVPLFVVYELLRQIVGLLFP